MDINLVKIGNFRKLQKVRADLAENTTVFVGANNSGKTSAMVALRHFLVGRIDFSINDFTLSNWAKLDALGQQWEASEGEEADQPFDWNAVLPHLDVRLDEPERELHYVRAPRRLSTGTSSGVRRLGPRAQHSRLKIAEDVGDHQ
ncbi:ATP-binding protein [Paraburkholderia sprentiae WSM5005]|uniref:ATP-binding protein n=1 Tax=Paraburkholderia sprentiae WSM5005 TaxID=754502 RepID=A0A1I9YRZ3_9BURK|nr:AAA family ATPase [Paraburkholderia sprentiae]APA88976.1 ATP-binding protein [Paraburkholderia sprentiae WSM5005]